MKHLTLRPQKLVDDYLQGKRKEIFNPVSFLIIVVTLFLIWDAMHRNGVEKTGHEKPYEMGHKTAQFILEYFKYFWLLSIAWLGFGTRILFRKLSLAEHFAISAFIIGQATLAGLLMSLVRPTTIIANPVVYVVMAVMVFRVYKRNDTSIPLVLFKTFLAMCLFAVQLLITIMLVIVFVNGSDTVIDLILEEHDKIEGL